MRSLAAPAAIESLEPRRLLSAVALGGHGVGVIGDSYSDEYQFYPPDRSTAKNWVELLAAHRGVNFGAFTNAARPVPRNQGFAFNWAQDGDATGDALADGQVRGLVKQVRAGQVSLVTILIGGDDYLNLLDSANPAKGLVHAAPAAIRHIRSIVNAVLRANPNVKIAISTLPDVSDLPILQQAVQAGEIPAELVAGMDQSVHAVNEFIRSLGANGRIAVADFAKATADVYARSRYTVGGVRIHRLGASDDPTSLILADGIHTGTVGQAEFANVFVHAVDTKFHAGILPFSNSEILDFAGIKHT